MISSAEDLRELVTEIARDSPNPHDVAARVLDKLTGDAVALEIALRLSFPGWVVNTLKRPRVAPHATTPATTSASPSLSVEPPRVYVDTEGQRRVSPKTAALVDWYTARLNASVKVGASIQDWKRLGECTVSELRWMAALRRTKAAADLSVAEVFENLAAALAENSADTVADLDRSIGEAILKGRELGRHDLDRSIGEAILKG